MLVGSIPVGLSGLEIQMTAGNTDIDLQLTSSSSSSLPAVSTEVVNYKGSIIFESSQVTKTWNGDSITYSGYNGDGTGLGNEFVRFNDDNNHNAYQIFAYGYTPGVAAVTYAWTGQANCTDDGQGLDFSGSGVFSQEIEVGTVITVGELPAGLTDVYIRLDSASDIDIQVYDGNVAIVKRDGGLVSGMLCSASCGNVVLC